MKKLLLLFVLIAFNASAQTVRSIGVGCYFHSPMVSYQGKISNDGDFIIKQAPFAAYSFNVGRVGGSLGLGYWNNRFKYSVSLADGTVASNSENRHSVFIPITVGINLINSQFKLGFFTGAHLRYVYQFARIVEGETHIFTEDELTFRHYKRFSTSAFLETAASFDIGRFYPRVAVGFLNDFANDYNKFVNPYASLSINYQLNGKEK